MELAGVAEEAVDRAREAAADRGVDKARDAAKEWDPAVNAYAPAVEQL